MTCGYEIDAIDVAANVSTSRSKNADESNTLSVVVLGRSNPLEQGHGPLATIGADADDHA